jgi:precorrin-8X/cobalt-precorrin-8 methylmutase
VIETREIEKRSFRIIEKGLTDVPFPEREVVKRVVHATADFDFASLVVFNNNAIERGIEAIKSGKDVITDVNMVKAGIDSKALARYGGEVKCFIAHDETYAMAKNSGRTRARSAFRAFEDGLQNKIIVIGNAPTALFELCTLIERGIKPAIVIATPVGFVGARESKEQILNYDIPCIVVKGHKGGSTVAVAIMNALIKLSKGEQDD